MRPKPLPKHAAAPPATIYVQIPAYRDTELGATLADLYRKAERPEALRVAVMWQRGDDERLSDAVRRLPNLELIEIPFRQSRGCNWARLNLQRRWRGEPFTLFLDSHHRFVRGWDRILLDMHEGLIERGVERPLITGYLPSYDPLAHAAERRRSPYRIYPARRESGLLVHLTSYAIPGWRRLEGPVPADFASAHFIFARGEFNEDLRWDPRIYFAGDEVAMSLRAHTHGYDLFHPNVVIGWHCYDRRSRVPHWDDHAGWSAQQRASLERLRRLFSGRLRGRYGLGRSRTRQSYEDRLLVPLIERAG
ncbi:MAG: hypothetical protein QOJ94_2994 [Sphingomonadales bacterium]|jgi:hypothetical protein|nr:hypothetical protein [Sphingomonadales bacterium]